MNNPVDQKFVEKQRWPLVLKEIKILIDIIWFQKQFLWCCLVYLVIINGLRCLVRNQDWRTEESIFLAGLKVSQNNAKLWNNVGHALESTKEYSQVIFNIMLFSTVYQRFRYDRFCRTCRLCEVAIPNTAGHRISRLMC